MAIAPVAEFYAYASIILADFLLGGSIILLVIIQKEEQQGLGGEGIKILTSEHHVEGGYLSILFSLL